MSNDREIQLSFLQWVKEKSSGEFSFVDELAYLLDISKDSAYRRLRGETLLTFNEIKKISQHYKASLDAFFTLSSESVIFQKHAVSPNYSYLDFLRSVLNSLKLLDKNKGHKMTYVAKDIPPFHYFQFPELGHFKSFFWLKTILKDPQLQSQSYGDNTLNTEVLRVTKETWDTYVAIPSLEIWSDETINITLRQIEYYYESHLLNNEQVSRIVDELHQMIEHIRKEAEEGIKFTLGKPIDRVAGGVFQLYHNEIEIGDNTVFFSMENCMVYKTYNMLNLLSTTDKSFCADIEKYIDNILQKSVPISSSSEKERVKFFNIMFEKIDRLKTRVGLNKVNQST